MCPNAPPHGFATVSILKRRLLKPCRNRRPLTTAGMTKRLTVLLLTAPFLAGTLVTACSSGHGPGGPPVASISSRRLGLRPRRAGRGVAACWPTRGACAPTASPISPTRNPPATSSSTPPRAATSIREIHGSRRPTRRARGSGPAAAPAPAARHGQPGCRPRRRRSRPARPCSITITACAQHAPPRGLPAVLVVKRWLLKRCRNRRSRINEVDVTDR